MLPVHLALAALLLAAPASALHRDSKNAARITTGAAHLLPGTRSWGRFLTFTSTEDLTKSGNTGRQVYLFSLFQYDCFNHTNTETTCPPDADLTPYLVQVTSGAGNPDNPTVDASGTLVAFDADGTFNGGTGPAAAHRQIFLVNLGATPTTITAITSNLAGAGQGDSVRPSFAAAGAVLAFESTAPLSGPPMGVSQIFTDQLAGGGLTRITAGQAPSTHPMFTKDGSKLTFESAAALDGNGNGPASNFSQIYLYDRSKQVNGARLKQVTIGNLQAHHPYMAEKFQYVFYDAAPTDPSGTPTGPAQVFGADISTFPSTITQVTHGPGSATWPAVPESVDRVAFLADGDLLGNATTGHRVFVREFNRTQNGLTFQTLFQITGRGEVLPPIGASLGQWFVTLATTDDMSGTGICESQIHIVDYFNQPIHWPAATTPGQVPSEPAPGSPNAGCDDLKGCTTDTCNAGTCEHNKIADTTPCAATICSNDGTCEDGVCIATSKCDDSNGCTDDTCDPFLGCHHTPVQGPCKPCATVADCNDQNLCTDDACTNFKCVNTPKAQGADCSTPCRVGDTCNNAGTCGGGTDKDCSDSDPCTNDLCNPSNGSCQHPLIQGCKPCTDVSQCADGNPCTTKNCVGNHCTLTNLDGNLCANNNPCDGTEFCQNGLCTGVMPPNPCNPPDACHTGACDPNAPNNCRFDPIPGCQTCGGPSDPPCFDGNPCTSDVCLSGRCIFQPVPDNTPCDDGDKCNGISRCHQAACVPGVPPNCDDGFDCTDDSCDPQQGCQHVPQNTFCDDGNPCTNDVCSLSLGCVHVANHNPCDDGNLCTANDVCSSGLCTGTPNTCDDGNPCTDDFCSVTQGCTHTAKPNGTHCGPGDGCTNFPTCSNGQCVGNAGTGSCADDDACTVDTCTTAGCQHTAPSGFNGIFCRLGELEVLMSKPPLRPGLAALVARAGRHVERAEAVSISGAVRNLRIAEGTLRKFIARMIRGDGNVPRDRAVDIAHKARDVLRPLSALRADYAALRTRH